MNMNWNMQRNDFKRNRAGNLALLLFMILAAGLVVAATIVVTQLMTSMSAMYQTAKPPHFLQMHKGEIDEQKIDQFEASYPGVTAWQTVGMIDVYGENIKIQGKDTFDLSNCRLDISLVKQNKDYDRLLDENRSVLTMKKGEIGIPVILLEEYNIKLGDKVILTSNGITRTFKVAAFVHDAQMNSTLCSSTRILISDKDFAELFGKAGEKEYLIETYFRDSAMASDFQTAYENADLPQNGQAVTYTIIFLLSALTDLVMAMVLILVSVLLLLIAMMCIKYTLLAALEEEISEIGTMKAIGMSFRDIRELYLTKYKRMLTIGIIIGYVLALILSRTFMEHVTNTFGRQPVTILTISIPVAACFLVYLITIQYCKGILNKLKKLTVVDAMTRGKGFGRKERVSDGLHKGKLKSVELLLSIWEVSHNLNGFALVFLVLFLVSTIVIIPMNMLTTMQSKQFITYMGSTMDDIQVEIDTGKNLESRFEKMEAILKKDEAVKDFEVLRRVRVETVNSEGSRMNLTIDCGKRAGGELKYLEGKAPSTNQEIALSKLNADAMGVIIGKKIELTFSGIKEQFMVSGIYQDVTSGGYTAKAIQTFDGVKTMKYTVSINLKDRSDVKGKAEQWSSKLGCGYDIEPMDEFINQTLGGVTRQVEMIVVVVAIIGILLSALIVILFMKLRMAKDIAQIAAMKAIGFTNLDVRKQYLYKIGIVSMAGILGGTIVSNLAGNSMVSLSFQTMGLGISRISLLMNPWMVFAGVPLMLLLVTAGMTWLSTEQIKKYNIVSLINE